MKKGLGILAAVAAAGVLATVAAHAQGLEDLHSQRAEGGRWCMSDHFHTGSSSGQDSKQAAERSAIESWSSFTAWEYGNHWGSWRIAGSKSLRCGNPSGSWGCQAEARPCRPLVGGGGGGAKRRAKAPAKKSL